MLQARMTRSNILLDNLVLTKHYQIIMKTFPTFPQRFFINHVHDPRVPLVGKDKHIGLLRRTLTMLLGILISNGMSYRFYGDTKIPLPCTITPNRMPSVLSET